MSRNSHLPEFQRSLSLVLLINVDRADAERGIDFLGVVDGQLAPFIASPAPEGAVRANSERALPVGGDGLYVGQVEDADGDGIEAVPLGRPSDGQGTAEVGPASPHRTVASQENGVIRSARRRFN